MKKFFVILAILAALLPAVCFAAEPAVTAGSKSFNPLTGVWSLEDNVTVRIGDRVITADKAQVNMYQLSVNAQGNIKLVDNEENITFTSDEVEVDGRESTVHCIGSCNFTQGDITITAEDGVFSWDSKLATFNGNVRVNGQSKNSPVVYDVINQKFK